MKKYKEIWGSLTMSHKLNVNPLILRSTQYIGDAQLYISSWDLFIFLCGKSYYLPCQLVNPKFAEMKLDMKNIENLLSGDNE